MKNIFLMAVTVSLLVFPRWLHAQSIESELRLISERVAAATRGKVWPRWPSNDAGIFPSSVYPPDGFYGDPSDYVIYMIGCEVANHNRHFSVIPQPGSGLRIRELTTDDIFSFDSWLGDRAPSRDVRLSAIMSASGKMRYVNDGRPLATLVQFTHYLSNSRQIEVARVSSIPDYQSLQSSFNYDRVGYYYFGSEFALGNDASCTGWVHTDPRTVNMLLQNVVYQRVSRGVWPIWHFDHLEDGSWYHEIEESLVSIGQFRARFKLMSDRYAAARDIYVRCLGGGKGDGRPRDLIGDGHSRFDRTFIGSGEAESSWLASDMGDVAMPTAGAEDMKLWTLCVDDTVVLRDVAGIVLPGPPVDCVSGRIDTGGSEIDNGTMTYRHEAFDFGGAREIGCGPCGGQSGGGMDATGLLRRVHRYDLSARNSSFGPGVFAGWDVTMSGHSDLREWALWDPRRRDMVCLENDGSGRLVDRERSSVKGAVLLDSAGMITNELSQIAGIRVDEWSGSSLYFEVRVSDDVYARAVRFTDSSHMHSAEVVYGNGVDPSGPEWSFARKLVFQNGCVLNIDSSIVLPSGKLAVGSISLSGQPAVVYEYGGGPKGGAVWN